MGSTKLIENIWLNTSDRNYFIESIQSKNQLIEQQLIDNKNRQRKNVQKEY